jgi:four helix bundle protein
VINSRSSQQFAIIAKQNKSNYPNTTGLATDKLYQGSMNRKIYSFEKLQVWQTAAKLDKSIFELTKKFPKKEEYILISQIQRASISICSNIAEGSGRRKGKDQGQFYKIAYSSLLEVINQLLLSVNRQYLTEEEFIQHFEQDIQIIMNQLRALYKYSITSENGIPK